MHNAYLHCGVLLKCCPNRHNNQRVRQPHGTKSKTPVLFLNLLMQLPDHISVQNNIDSLVCEERIRT
jgi:hypothetical protein